MNTITTPIIRPLAPTDFDAWSSLYQGYAEFYRVQQTPEMRERVWSWLMDSAHPVKGLIALDAEGVALGLAHYRPYSRPLSASTGGFLDDLFVAPAARGLGVARALIVQLQAIAQQNNWTVLRWITAQDNQTAQALYDQIATKTQWLTYDLAP